MKYDKYEWQVNRSLLSREIFDWQHLLQKRHDILTIKGAHVWYKVRRLLICNVRWGPLDLPLYISSPFTYIVIPPPTPPNPYQLTKVGFKVYAWPLPADLWLRRGKWCRHKMGSYRLFPPTEFWVLPTIFVSGRIPWISIDIERYFNTRLDRADLLMKLSQLRAISSMRITSPWERWSELVISLALWHWSE